MPHARFLDAAVAAAARDQAVFDAAVDLGLAGGTADRHALRAIATTYLRAVRPRPATWTHGLPRPGPSER